MHHTFIELGIVSWKNLNPYGAKYIQNVAEVDGICICLYSTKEERWFSLWSANSCSIAFDQTLFQVQIYSIVAARALISELQVIDDFEIDD